MFRVIVLVILLVLVWMITGFPTGTPMTDGVPFLHTFLENTGTRWLLAAVLLIPAAVIAFALTKALPLVRIVVVLLVVFGIALGARWLYEQEGGLDITLMGNKLSFSVLQMVALGALASVGIVLFYNGLRWLWTGPRAVSRWIGEKRTESGYKHLSRAMVAIAAGEAGQARSHGRKAEGKLDDTAVTRLINAQAAQLDGDNAAAEGYFNAMLKDPETEFLGLRGLIVQAMRQGDKKAAMRHAKRAVALQPKSEWVNTTLFDLQAELGDWAEARKTISAPSAAKVFGKDVAHRRKAVLLMKEAEGLLAAGDTASAQPILMEAVKASPGLVPAAIAAAAQLGKQGDTRKAEKMLADVWVLSPHPDVVTAFSNLVPDEASTVRRARFARLFKLRPNHTETRMAKAELAIQAEDWEGAENALAPFTAQLPNARVCTLMATIEQGRGSGEDIVRLWLARALTASPGSAWVCSNCTHAAPVWEATCSACGAFDTLAWDEVRGGAAALALPNAAQGLLMIGSASATVEAEDQTDAMPVIVDAPPPEPEEPAQPEKQAEPEKQAQPEKPKPAPTAAVETPAPVVSAPIVVDVPAPKVDAVTPPRPDGV